MADLNIHNITNVELIRDHFKDKSMEFYTIKLRITDMCSEDHEVTLFSPTKITIKGAINARD